MQPVQVETVLVSSSEYVDQKRSKGVEHPETKRFAEVTTKPSQIRTKTQEHVRATYEVVGFLNIGWVILFVIPKIRLSLDH